MKQIICDVCEKAIKIKILTRKIETIDNTKELYFVCSNRDCKKKYHISYENDIIRWLQKSLSTAKYNYNDGLEKLKKLNKKKNVDKEKVKKFENDNLKKLQVINDIERDVRKEVLKLEENKSLRQK